MPPAPVLLAPPIPVVLPVVSLVVLGPPLPVVFEPTVALMLLELELLVAPPLPVVVVLVDEVVLVPLVVVVALLLTLLGPLLLMALELMFDVVTAELSLPLVDVRLVSPSGSSTTVAQPGIEPAVMDSVRSVSKPTLRHEFEAFKEVS